MQYDLIALDLDGTALSSSNEVQRSTIDAVQFAREHGVRVVVSTGRICSEAAEFARKLGAEDELVSAGGAAVCRASTGECLWRSPIPWEAGVRAAAILERANLVTMTYIENRIVLSPYSDFEFGRYKSNEGYLAAKQVELSVAEYIATNRLAVDKLFSRCATPGILQQARRQLQKLPGVRVMSSAADNVEVVAPGSDKGTALRRLCGLYGIAPERAAAVGDSENDLEMLAAVGMPIAMGNADERVKAIASYVTADNNHGGVAQAIHYLLGER